VRCAEATAVVVLRIGHGSLQRAESYPGHGFPAGVRVMLALAGIVEAMGFVPSRNCGGCARWAISAAGTDFGKALSTGVAGCG